MKTPLQWALALIVSATIAAIAVLWLPGPKNAYQLNFRNEDRILPALQLPINAAAPICSGARSHRPTRR